MAEDLDTLLIALSVVVDGPVVEAVEPRRRPGRLKRLSDVELVCLAVDQVLMGARSEHHWLRMCYGRDPLYLRNQRWSHPALIGNDIPICRLSRA